MDDLISRHAVRLIESDSNAYPEVWNESYEKGFCDAINRVLDLPSAHPERKKGKWLADNRPGGGFWVCSCCKFPSEAFAANVLYNFCPNCGAEMGGKS